MTADEHVCSRLSQRARLWSVRWSASATIVHRLLSFFLLAAVVVGYGGVGTYLHERFAHGDFGASTINGGASASRPVHPAEPAQKHGHDHHDDCPVCQSLAAARVSRLPQTVIAFIAAQPAPARQRPRDEAAPHVVCIVASVSARGPPSVAPAV